MMKKKTIFSVLIFMLVLTLVAGCGSQNNGAGNSQNQENNEANKQQNVDNNQEQEPTEITIFSTQFGSLGYTFAFALGEIINDNSPWLRARVVETLGTMDGLKQMFDARNRENSVAFLSTSFLTAVNQGHPPLDGPEEMNAILSFFLGGYTYATLDPEIKTAQDLVGKSVNVGSNAVGGPMTPEVMNALGIADQLGNTSAMGWDQAKNALMDGVLDASLMTYSIADGEFFPSPALNEIFSRGGHLISVEEEVINKVAENFPEAEWLEAPVGAFGEFQTEPVGMIKIVQGIVSTPDLPEEIAYEIVRVAVENNKIFGEQHAFGKALAKPENFPLFNSNAVPYNPGALEYYNEHDIPVQ